MKEEKRELREVMRAKLATLTDLEQERLSVGIVAQVCALVEQEKRRLNKQTLKIASFIAFGAEPDLSSLEDQLSDCELAYPRCLPNGVMHFYKPNTLASLVRSKFGILEPNPSPEHSKLIPPEDFDILLVPCYAYTRDGKRLGKGGGYYDRYMTQAQEAVRAGILFPCQLVDDLPTEDHDLSVDVTFFSHRKE